MLETVSSSTISAMGYDEPTMTLEVHFHSGSVYQYYDVPVDAYRQLREAPSKGQFFNEHIKPAYRYARL